MPFCVSRYSRTPGSSRPQRVPIRQPVERREAHRGGHAPPAASAHMLAPLPRCATTAAPRAISGAAPAASGDVLVGQPVKPVAAHALAVSARGSAKRLRDLRLARGTRYRSTRPAAAPGKRCEGPDRREVVRLVQRRQGNEAPRERRARRRPRRAGPSSGPPVHHAMADRLGTRPSGVRRSAEGADARHRGSRTSDTSPPVLVVGEHRALGVATRSLGWVPMPSMPPLQRGWSSRPSTTSKAPA